MADDVFLTVITPSFNRRNLLPRLYESLQKQTDQDFQWLLVDDGSTDATEKWADEIHEKEQKFDFLYLRKENGGKHRALNYAHPFIKGKLVTVADSDDLLTADAVEKIKRKWNERKEDNSVLLIFQRGNMINGRQFDNSFPGGDKTATLVYFTNKGMHGDHCEVTTRNEFVKYRFPEFPGEKFLGEAWLWQHIGDDGMAVFINEVIYLCDYLEGGLTKAGRGMRKKNPRGGMEHALRFLDRRYSVKIRIKNALLYLYYGHIAGFSTGELFHKSGYPELLMVAWVPSLLLRVYWHNK